MYVKGQAAMIQSYSLLYRFVQIHYLLQLNDSKVCIQLVPVLYSLNIDACKKLQVVKLNVIYFTNLAKGHIYGVDH